LTNARLKKKEVETKTKNEKELGSIKSTRLEKRGKRYVAK
jgi:hypothetical protein